MNLSQDRHEIFNCVPCCSSSATAGPGGQLVDRHGLCPEGVFDRPQTPRRRVEDSPQGRSVGGSMGQTQIGEQVFHLSACQQVELCAQTHGDTTCPECKREGPGLLAGARRIEAMRNARAAKDRNPDGEADASVMPQDSARRPREGSVAASLVRMLLRKARREKCILKMKSMSSYLDVPGRALGPP